MEYKKTAFITDIAGEGMAEIAEFLHAIGVYVLFLCRDYAELPNVLSPDFLADKDGYYAFAGNNPRNILYLSYIQERLAHSYKHLDYVIVTPPQIRCGGREINGVRDVIYALERSADVVYACAHILEAELKLSRHAYILVQTLAKGEPHDIQLNVARAAQTAVVQSLNADYQRKGILITCCEVAEDANMRAAVEQLIDMG